MKHVLNYGGGVNSTALLIEMIKRNMPIDYIIFADTGEEFPETYEFINIFEAWINKKGKQLIKVKSKYGKLYEYFFVRNTIPYRKFRDCTDKFKKRPINEFLKPYKKEGIIQYIGIALEEYQRMRTSDIKNITLKYPLVEFKIDRDKCKEIIKSEGLPIPIKSGCYLCPFQSAKSWKKLFNEYPNLWYMAREIEEHNKTYPKNTLYYEGPLKNIEIAIKTQTKLSDFEEGFCGVYCYT